MKIAYRKILKPFEADYNGSIVKFETGKYVLALPSCDTNTHYMIAYEHSPFHVEKEYLSDKTEDDVDIQDVI